MNIARHGTASHVEQLVSKYKRVKRSMEDETEQEREEARKLVYYQDEDGMWVINARLSPEVGSLLVKAIEALVAPIQEQKRVRLLEDGNGKVLNIGRRARTVPPSLRRALDVRDKTCRFPGCCESRHVDAHHIEHWADGGETSLDNLVTLCRNRIDR